MRLPDGSGGVDVKGGGSSEVDVTGCVGDTLKDCCGDVANDALGVDSSVPEWCAARALKKASNSVDESETGRGTFSNEPSMLTGVAEPGGAVRAGASNGFGDLVGCDANSLTENPVLAVSTPPFCSTTPCGPMAAMSASRAA